MGAWRDVMSHPSSKVETVDGVRVEAKSFKTNLYLYKSIGGSVEVRGEPKRRWWCGWLCKTREEVDADRISFDNTYYTRYDGTAILLESASHQGECTNASDCTLKHWAVGIGVQIKFPGGDASPTGVTDLLPLDGVMSSATVVVRGRSLRFETAAGSHPS
jgi:hypothetical protein